MTAATLTRLVVSVALLTVAVAALVVPESPMWETFSVLSALFVLASLERSDLRRPVEIRGAVVAILVVAAIVASIGLSMLFPNVARLVYWKPSHISPAAKVAIALAWTAGVAALWHRARRSSNAT